mmetsp:Transcript_26634/g.32339  ORF Transcript_26634/g.32339 Transcript_26634/m.32339 type:complete len:930 (-) Transcript_26634:134-2923(-)
MSDCHMLSAVEKKGVLLELTEPLTEYVTDVFSEHEAQNIQDDLEYVDETRASLLLPISGNLESRKDALQRYYKALSAMETRFPISKDTPGLDTITFTWHDAFRSSKKISQANLQFEKAAVLFNLGAIHSQQGAAADRSSQEGIKLACHNFQAAAGMFAMLRDTLSSKIVTSGAVDLSEECAGMLVSLMLAQAQECFHEKTITDNKSPGIVAKLAKQVNTYYEEARAALMSSTLSGHLDKAWLAHVAAKASLFNADCNFRSAQTFDPTENIAARIARLRQATQQLADAKAKAKGLTVFENVAKLEAIVSVELDLAEKDNKCVYMEKVPSADTLPPITGHALVKPLPAADTLSSDDKLFSAIVPDSSTKAMSKYSEMVDSLMREQLALLEDTSETSQLCLLNWDIDSLLESLNGSGYNALPDTFKKQLQDVSVQGVPAQVLQSLSEQLKEMQHGTMELVEEAEKKLAKEADEDRAMRDRYGPHWDRPPSHQLNDSLKKRLGSYREKLSKAHDNDRQLLAHVEHSLDSFCILSPEGIGRVLPKLEAPMLSVVDGAEGPNVAAELRRMKNEFVRVANDERREVERSLRSLKESDDILPKMMAVVTDNHDDLFAKELQKYDQVKEAVAENVKKQKHLCQKLNEQQELFRKVFQVDEWKAACHKASEAVGEKITQYLDLLRNVQEGIEFYTTLQDALAELSTSIQDYAMSRMLQKNDLQKHLQAHAQHAQRPQPPTQQFQQLSVAPHSIQPPQYPQVPHQPNSPSAPPVSPGAPPQVPQQAPAPAHAYSQPSAYTRPAAQAHPPPAPQQQQQQHAGYYQQQPQAYMQQPPQHQHRPQQPPGGQYQQQAAQTPHYQQPQAHAGQYHQQHGQQWPQYQQQHPAPQQQGQYHQQQHHQHAQQQAYAQPNSNYYQQPAQHQQQHPQQQQHPGYYQHQQY